MQMRFDSREQLFEILRLIGRIDFDLTRMRQGLLAGSGLTPGGQRILDCLATRGPMSVADVARALAMKRQFVQRLVGELVAAGLVETEANPADRRSFRCRPSERGRALHERLHAAESTLMQQHLGELNMTEVIVTLRLLGRVSSCLSDVTRPGAMADPCDAGGGRIPK